MSALVSCREMRGIEEAAFARGVLAEDLMEEAGLALASWVGRRARCEGTAVGFLGRGNNAGDVLVALRHLRGSGWEIRLAGSEEGGELREKQRRRLEEEGQVERWRGQGIFRERRPVVFLDGLLGIGGRGELREPLAGWAEEMNRERREAGVRVVAVDIPSGVDGDTGEVFPAAVCADETFCLGAVKQGLVADRAANHVGRIGWAALNGLPVAKGGDRMTGAADLRGWLRKRDFDTHKGMAGRVGIVAGSPGMAGAAALAAAGALRGGAGLVTVFTEPSVRAEVAALAPPEVMTKEFSEAALVLEAGLDVLVFGPGLGRPEGGWRRELLGILEDFGGPAVVDADGLNLAGEEGAEGLLKENRLATPHPGEFARLMGGRAFASRAEAARAFSGNFPATLLLKGCRTLVSKRGAPLFHNPTGSPGMATAGQGDVLAGLLGALLGQGLESVEAARAGAWLAGRSAELVLQGGGESEESLTAGEVARGLGRAFRELRGG